jgi:hypothetical protein
VRGYIKIGGKFSDDEVGYADDRYIFDEVLNQEATQSMVFERTAKPLLPGVLEGYNATIFAYGVSPFLALGRLILIYRRLDAGKLTLSVVDQGKKESLSDPWSTSTTNSRKTRKRTTTMSSYLLSRSTTRLLKISFRIQTRNGPVKASRC